MALELRVIIGGGCWELVVVSLGGYGVSGIVTFFIGDPVRLGAPSDFMRLKSSIISSVISRTRLSRSGISFTRFQFRLAARNLTAFQEDVGREHGLFSRDFL